MALKKQILDIQAELNLAGLRGAGGHYAVEQVAQIVAHKKD